MDEKRASRTAGSSATDARSQTGASRSAVSAILGREIAVTWESGAWAYVVTTGSASAPVRPPSARSFAGGAPDPGA